jgi:hypothetical protein
MALLTFNLQPSTGFGAINPSSGRFFPPDDGITHIQPSTGFGAINPSSGRFFLPDDDIIAPKPVEG